MTLRPAIRIPKSLRKILKAAHRFTIANRTLAHLEKIRQHELTIVLGLLPPIGRLLEIGAGTGWQALALAKRGYDVFAVDLPNSNYATDRVYSVIDYDGHTLPFDSHTFDIIYSSNLLEHIPHTADFQEEIHRVVRGQGCVIHIVPSGSWRFWTNLTHMVRYISLPHTHGEHAANALTEVVIFSRRAWRQTFHKAGWIIVSEHKNQLFYTGNSIFDNRLGITMRKWLSYFLGSSCHIFVLRKKHYKLN